MVAQRLERGHILVRLMDWHKCKRYRMNGFSCPMEKVPNHKKDDKEPRGNRDPIPRTDREPLPPFLIKDFARRTVDEVQKDADKEKDSEWKIPDLEPYVGPPIFAPPPPIAPPVRVPRPPVRIPAPPVKVPTNGLPERPPEERPEPQLPDLDELGEIEEIFTEKLKQYASKRGYGEIDLDDDERINQGGNSPRAQEAVSPRTVRQARGINVTPPREADVPVRRVGRGDRPRLQSWQRSVGGAAVAATASLGAYALYRQGQSSGRGRGGNVGRSFADQLLGRGVGYAR